MSARVIIFFVCVFGVSGVVLSSLTRMEMVS